MSSGAGSRTSDALVDPALEPVAGGLVAVGAVGLDREVDQHGVVGLLGHQRGAVVGREHVVGRGGDVGGGEPGASYRRERKGENWGTDTLLAGARVPPGRPSANFCKQNARGTMLSAWLRPTSSRSTSTPAWPSRLTQAKAEALVKELVKAGEVQTEQAQAAVTDLVERSRKNTEAFIDQVRKEIADLGRVPRPGHHRRHHPPREADRRPITAPRGTAKKPPAKKAARPRRPPPRRPRPRRPRPRRPPAKKAAAKKAAAKKAPAKKAAAKKAPAKKAAAAKKTAS